MTVWCFITGQDNIMSKDTDYKMFVITNEKFSAASFLYLHGNNNEDDEKLDTVTNISFESIILSIKIISFISSWLIFPIK